MRALPRKDGAGETTHTTNILTIRSHWPCSADRAYLRLTRAHVQSAAALRDVCGGRRGDGVFFRPRAGPSVHSAARHANPDLANGRPSGDKPIATSSSR